MTRLPNFATSQPAKGRENIKPMGSDSNTAPNPASFRFKFCCILGILDVQLEKHRPERKNREDTAMRKLLLALYNAVSLLMVIELLFRQVSFPDNIDMMINVPSAYKTQTSNIHEVIICRACKS